MNARRHSTELDVIVNPPIESWRWLAMASAELVGLLHVDAAAAAAARGAVGTYADVVAVDTAGDLGQVGRKYSRSDAPAEDAMLIERLEALVPPFGRDGSPVERVLREGRTVLRGEVGASVADSYSMLMLPAYGPDGLVAAITLATFGQAERYGRTEVRVLEEYARRVGHAIAAAAMHERTEAARMMAASHRDVLEATGRSLERSLADASEELVTLRSENAAMRVLLAAYERGDEAASPAPSPPQPVPVAGLAPPVVALRTSLRNGGMRAGATP